MEYKYAMRNAKWVVVMFFSDIKTFDWSIKMYELDIYAKCISIIQGTLSSTNYCFYSHGNE